MDGDDGTSLPTPYFRHHHAAAAGFSPPASGARGALFSPSSSTPDGPGSPVVLFPHHTSAALLAPPPAAAEPVKRKRGRPRKYGVAPSTSTPASASASLRRRVPPPPPFSPSPSPPLSSAVRKKHASSFSSSPKKMPLAARRDLGKGFTPHVIRVADGEDVAQKIISFMQQSKRAVCVLSASGVISSALLRQPAAYGGYVTYQGKYDIASICGSFLPAGNGGASGSGGLSVCLSGTDGCLVGGGVGGHLLAAGAVDVVAGSFLIDTDKDPSAARTFDGSASKQSVPKKTGATLVTPLPLRATSEYAERTTASRESHDHQSVRGSSYLIQSQEMHMLAPFSSKDSGGPDGLYLLIKFTVPL